MEKRKYEIPPRTRMPERQVLSDEELDAYADAHYADIVKRARDIDLKDRLGVLLGIRTGRCSLPHVEDLDAVLAGLKRG